MARLSKVAVVGGGIGGLTATPALLREGIDVDVYEQASEFQKVGAGVQISSKRNMRAARGGGSLCHPRVAAGADHGALRLALHLQRHGGSNLSRGQRAADGLLSGAQHQILDTDA
jgi:2-polyprenyl-6-methoxyphenol hydroxylase-like FAD-dependent oxidoreductase